MRRFVRRNSRALGDAPLVAADRTIVVGLQPPRVDSRILLDRSAFSLRLAPLLVQEDAAPPFDAMDDSIPWSESPAFQASEPQTYLYDKTTPPTSASVQEMRRATRDRIFMHLRSTPAAWARYSMSRRYQRERLAVHVMSVAFCMHDSLVEWFVNAEAAFIRSALGLSSVERVADIQRFHGYHDSDDDANVPLPERVGARIRTAMHACRDHITRNGGAAYLNSSFNPRFLHFLAETSKLYIDMT